MMTQLWLSWSNKYNGQEVGLYNFYSIMPFPREEEFVLLITLWGTLKGKDNKHVLFGIMIRASEPCHQDSFGIQSLH